MQTFDDIPGVEAWRLSLPDVLVTIGRDAVPEPTPAVAARWAELSRANPRLYDGPILSVKSIDTEHSHIHTARDRYSRLAVFPQVRTGSRLLAVTGLLLARDLGGRQYALAGKRGQHVSRYPMSWEFGPSGGMAPPPPNIDRFGIEFVVSHLREELDEEIHLDDVEGTFSPIAYMRDHAVMSDDIVLLCDLGQLDGRLATLAPGNWEYSDVRWVPTDSVQSFIDAEPTGMIPTSRALARLLGWTSTPS